MAKPMKTLELHYPMIQFLIKNNIPGLELDPEARTIPVVNWANRLEIIVHEISKGGLIRLLIESESHLTIFCPESSLLSLRQPQVVAFVLNYL